MKFVGGVGIVVVAVISVCLCPPPQLVAVKSAQSSIRKLPIRAVPVLVRPGLPSILFFLVGLQARSRASAPVGGFIDPGDFWGSCTWVVVRGGDRGGCPVGGHGVAGNIHRSLNLRWVLQ